MLSTSLMLVLREDSWFGPMLMFNVLVKHPIQSKISPVEVCRDLGLDGRKRNCGPRISKEMMSHSDPPNLREGPIDQRCAAGSTQRENVPVPGAHRHPPHFPAVYFQLVMLCPPSSPTGPSAYASPHRDGYRIIQTVDLIGIQ